MKLTIKTLIVLMGMHTLIHAVSNPAFEKILKSSPEDRQKLAVWINAKLIAVSFLGTADMRENATKEVAGALKFYLGKSSTAVKNAIAAIEEELDKNPYADKRKELLDDYYKQLYESLLAKGKEKKDETLYLRVPNAKEEFMFIMPVITSK